MNETQAQTHLVNEIRKRGGAANKLSHRFLVGVSDLLIKVPGHPAGLFEVKIDTSPTKVGYVRPGLTVPQSRFLRSFHDAGMTAAVWCLVRRDQMVGMRLVSIEDVGTPFKVCLDTCTWCRSQDWRMTAWNDLIKFMEGRRDRF